MDKPRQMLVQGDEACAYGALAAGCRFFAGYPITPSSEIMEVMTRELPRVDGVFIQMEDEIGSLAAVIGASWAGAKAMTATSGPGFSLMQEGIGYAAMTETPCVIVDAQRWGPSTGQPTQPSQGDVMQSIWGTHGDHPIIVLTASSVSEVYRLIVTAFNFAERYRTPVIFLLDGVLAHMWENIKVPEPDELEVVSRKRPQDLEAFAPFRDETMLNFGDGVRFNVTGMAHDEWGWYANGQIAEGQLKRIVAKVEDHRAEIALYETHSIEDARSLVISYGTPARAAESAVLRLRDEGVAVGLVDLNTLWPFPTDRVREWAEAVDYILVPELNLGQLVREVRLAAEGRAQVETLSRVDGSLITPQQIYERVRQRIG
ncbi:MAG: 2-oxoacid:acceptor oxidoreductase subunit alpha [Candidatus Bipolaricaulia bacterium]